MYEDWINYVLAANGIAIGSFLVYRFLIYPGLLSPLAKIPSAHWTCPFTSWWILWIRYRGEELRVANEAHKKLGPIVRLGPKDLSVSCYEDGIRTIYGGGFDKPVYFDFFNYYGKPNSFCSLARKDHSLRRRRMSLVYTKSALFGSAQLASITESILFGRLLPRLLKHASDPQPTETLELTYSLCLDYVNCFIFGYSSGPNFLQQEGTVHPFLEHYEQRYCKESFWPQELPRTTRFLKTVGINMVPKTNVQSTKYLEQWMMRLCDNADVASSLADRGELKDAGDIPIVYQQVKRAVDMNSKELDPHAKRLEVASELFDHMSGAREVLGLVLSYTVYYISQNSSAQERLRAELLSLTPSMVIASGHIHNGLPSPSSLDNLPYLSAVLKESLRMRPNSTPLPRITPNDHSVTLAGVEKIPPRTRVNAFQWFVHRDPRQWTQPDRWMPERWLHHEGDKPQGGDEGILWAFGSGPRMCVGSHLSYYMMRYILALIFSNFKTHAVPDASFGLHPPGSLHDRLFVRFERLDPNSTPPKSL